MTSAGPIGGERRPHYLFSGLMKCGTRGAGFIMGSKNRLGCFGARNQVAIGQPRGLGCEEVEPASSAFAGEAASSGPP
jgi:hypothetical protein